MELKDEFPFQTGGTLIAMRVVLAALLKTHPAPEQSLQEIRAILSESGALDSQLPAPVQAAFDKRMQELTSYLYARASNLRARPNHSFKADGYAARLTPALGTKYEYRMGVIGELVFRVWVFCRSCYGALLG